MKNSMIRYSVMLVGVPAAFYTVVILSVAVTRYFSLWAEPIAGFFAAVTVVLVGYWLAPHHKIAAAAVWLLVGAISAWALLAGSHYPESFGVNYAYRPTYIPLALTYLGGAVGLFICYREELKNSA